jgi:hypothetical protein
LDAAVNAGCPKVIIFDVGGLIERNGEYIMNVCNQWSIVGASAPGEVVLASGPTGLLGLLRTNGNNWTIDHLTLAAGTTEHGLADSLNIGDGGDAAVGEGTGIVLNNTFIWGGDETVSCYPTASDDDPQSDILFWQNDTGVFTTSELCSAVNFIRTIFVHTHERAPKMLGGPFFHANNITANARVGNVQLDPCGGDQGVPESPWQVNVMYNIRANSNTVNSRNVEFIELQTRGCVDAQVYEFGNQVRDHISGWLDCTNHACAVGEFQSADWESSIVAGAYPTGYVPEVITANAAVLEAFSQQVADHVGSRPTNRLPYTQASVVDKMLG